MLSADTHGIASLRTAEPVDDGVHSVWASTRAAEAIASFMECLYPEVIV